MRVAYEGSKLVSLPGSTEKVGSIVSVVSAEAGDDMNIKVAVNGRTVLKLV
jgi:hypothetical protein